MPQTTIQNIGQVKLEINNERDREAMIVALANAGYSVVVEVEEDICYRKTYYVLFYQ